MIIDTNKLRDAIDSRDDTVDWEHCPMSRLTFLEKRVIESRAALDKVEEHYRKLVAPEGEQ